MLDMSKKYVEKSTGRPIIISSLDPIDFGRGHIVLAKFNLPGILGLLTFKFRIDEIEEAPRNWLQGVYRVIKRKLVSMMRRRH